MGDIYEAIGRSYGDTRSYQKQTPENPRDRKFIGHSAVADLALLGLKAMPAGPDALADAFRAQVKALAGSGADMDDVKQARDRIREAMSRIGDQSVNLPSESTCLSCGGSGRIGVGFGRVCSTCKGTGHTT